MERIRRVAMGSLMLFAGATAGLGAQTEDPIAAYYPFRGCYQLSLDSEPYWTRGLERRVNLTMVSLERSPHLVVYQLLMRPAPGEPASAYERPHWTLVGNSSPLVLEWEWPSYVWIRAEFDVSSVENVPDSGLVGILRYADHTPGTETQPVGARITPIPCTP